MRLSKVIPIIQEILTPKISVYNIYQDFKVFSTTKDKIIKKQKDVTVKQDSLFVSPSPRPLKK